MLRRGRKRTRRTNLCDERVGRSGATTEGFRMRGEGGRVKFRYGNTRLAR